jgi:hypothetical protein
MDRQHAPDPAAGASGNTDRRRTDIKPEPAEVEACPLKTHMISVTAAAKGSVIIHQIEAFLVLKGSENIGLPNRPPVIGEGGNDPE